MTSSFWMTLQQTLAPVKPGSQREDKIEGDRLCGVFLDDFTEFSDMNPAGSLVVTLVPGHAFHQRCSDNWRVFCIERTSDEACAKCRAPIQARSKRVNPFARAIQVDLTGTNPIDVFDQVNVSISTPPAHSRDPSTDRSLFASPSSQADFLMMPC